MTDFRDNIKAVVREVLAQDIGIKNNEVRDAVWEIIDKKISERINQFIEERLTDSRLDYIMYDIIERIFKGRYKENPYPFKSEISKMMEDVAKRIEFSVSVKPKTEPLSEKQTQENDDD